MLNSIRTSSRFEELLQVKPNNSDLISNKIMYTIM